VPVPAEFHCYDLGQGETLRSDFPDLAQLVDCEPCHT